MNNREDKIDSIVASAEQKARLLKEMDVTMMQKLAFASAHFQLHDGARILDIGCARGFGSYQLALLNPRLQVVGVDYDADYIARAKAQYNLPNLAFIQGDARNLDLVSRPGDVIDVIPYGVNKNGHLVIYAKASYPRPIVNIHPRAMANNIDGRTWSGHMVEPLSIANQKGSGTKGIKQVLCGRAGFSKKQIRSITGGMTYYTAPLDVNERVSSVFVNVEAAPYEHEMTGRFSNFAKDGVVRAFDVQDILRGVQVGMLPEARLELNIYSLMRQAEINPEPWIGDSYPVKSSDSVLSHQFNTLVGEGDHYSSISLNPDDAYLDVQRSHFVEEGADGVIASHILEFAVPAHKQGRPGPATNSVIVLPLVKRENDGEIMVGIEPQSYPSVQQKEGGGDIVSLPGYSIPSTVKNVLELRNYIVKKEVVPASTISPLGESYFASMGIMPHRVYPYIVSDPVLTERENLKFVPLREVFENLDECKDAHLMIAVCRAVHALGKWQDYAQGYTPSTLRRLTL